jgi:fatty-acyl-CoA synthase
VLGSTVYIHGINIEKKISGIKKLHQLDKLNTLWNIWEFNAKKLPDKEAVVFWNAGETPIRFTYKVLLEKANKYSIALKKKGIKSGQVCAIIIRHNPEFYPIYLGIVGIGALPAVLAYPNPRLHQDKFRQGIEGMSQRSGLDWILTERPLEDILQPLLSSKKTTIKGTFYPLEFDLIEDKKLQNEIDNYRKSIKDTDTVLLQHSSGTTGIQKPVVLSNKAIINHVNYYGSSINLKESDIVVSWLPLYHDMGLIAAFHIPLAFGITSIQIDPFQWVLAPRILLDAITTEKATLTLLPNFAFNILSDKISDKELEGVSLSSMRMFINCSEPVRYNSFEKFKNKFLKYGLDPSSLAASYAMAETTFAVTQSLSSCGYKTISIDKKKFTEGLIEIVDDRADSKTLVSSGKIINGCEVRIVDEKREDLPEGSIGEIAIKSVSMFDGYRNYPEKTAQAIDNGWYFSGDLGFILNEELFVIGRQKDLIIVAGKNIYPEDVEDIISNIPGVIPGRVVAFGEEDEALGTETISIVAETKIEEEKAKADLRFSIIKAGMKNELNISNIYLVPPRWLIKSSAGKPSRKANKERVLEQKNGLSHDLKRIQVGHS